MKKLGNFLWFLPCGLVFSLVWFLVGVALSVTLIGIPFGKQCFKLASLAIAPFGAEIQ